MKNTSVLFVCLGNICRSPTAHGIFQKMVDDQQLQHVISVDSAGTSGWHIDEPPDARTSAAAARRGYNLSELRGRQVTREDFENFDYILAMDHDNLQDLQDLQALKPQDYTGYLGLFLSFGTQTEYDVVPDPYHGGARGFELVLDLVEDACEGLLRQLKQNA
ncbi:Low molecular weight protein-tyrosine-phosphatase YfkJ [Thalassocella blandensis]|nr:Low molecular weight protein-tyrosine-phosphatase YfkJ [Thalassocella blandensis]